jgi:hypothetical protein
MPDEVFLFTEPAFVCMVPASRIDMYPFCLAALLPFTKGKASPGVFSKPSQEVMDDLALFNISEDYNITALILQEFLCQ